MKLIYYIWSLIERFGTNFVSLAGNIALSYLLLREDFGLVAMLAVFSNIIYVFVDCGLSDGLLMHEKPSNRDFNTVFYFNIATSISLCLIFCIASPFIVDYFQHEELGPIMIAFGFGAIISGSCIAQVTKLRSQLQFKKVAIFNMASVSLALIVAIIMALKGCRYWALVELQVGYSFFYLLLLIIFSKWNLKLEFDIQRFKELWKFGVNLLFSTFITQISQNIFTFVLGKYYNPIQAGYMWQAQKLQQAPTNSLEMSISSTSYVLISKNDNAESKRIGFVKMFGIFTFVNSFFLILIFSVSAPFIQAIFPEKWSPCIPYLQILLVWGLIYPVNNYMMILFKIFNLTKIIRNVMLFEKLCIIISSFALIPYGVYSILSAAIALSAATLFFYTWCARKHIGISQLRLFKLFIFNILPFSIIGALTIPTNYATNYSWINLMIGCVCYIALSLLFTKIKKPDYFSYIAQKAKAVTHRKS
ncbi:MAG: lipopolysaccharide biosynthesis protein [Bacteroidales bacterium]|nr:lipopolysaccharide biosynthesis protein [Bacteroidales bacterium]